MNAASQHRNSPMAIRLNPGRSVAAALLAALFCVPAQATTPPPYPAWLAGCWTGEGRSAGITEAWTHGRIGLMLGIGETLRGTRANFEFMRIATAADASLVFIAQPGGRPPVNFKATVVEATRIVFANPTHDSPKTIEYRREGDRLTVFLDAPASGAVPTFSFLRSDCSALFAPR